MWALSEAQEVARNRPPQSECKTKAQEREAGGAVGTEVKRITNEPHEEDDELALSNQIQKFTAPGSTTPGC